MGRQVYRTGRSVAIIDLNHDAINDIGLPALNELVLFTNNLREKMYR